MVTLLIANNPPAMPFNIAPQNLSTNSTTVALPFNVTDPESDAALASTPRTLSVSGSVSSTNPALVPQISLKFTGTGENRAVRVVHAGNQTGIVTIRLAVADTQCSHAFPPQPHAGHDQQHHHLPGEGECNRQYVRGGQ